LRDARAIEFFVTKNSPESSGGHKADFLHNKTSRLLLRSLVQLVANSDQIIESLADEIDEFLALF
jgi:hypothetical protein